MRQGSSFKYLTTKAVFTVTLIVIALTISGVWLFGLGQHRSIYDNSILSTTILSLGFFLFLTIGLYKGVKLKDNVGRMTSRIKRPRIPDLSRGAEGAEFIDLGDEIGGILLSIAVWLAVTVFLGVFLWLFGAVLWTGIIVFIAMLYWIFFRAVRLVFKNSNKCKSNLVMSMAYGLFYTLLYNCWIYAIIFGTHYLVNPH